MGPVRSHWQGETMFGRKKPLEERICRAIKVEFAGLVAELERDLSEYRCRSRIKEEAQVALDKAEAEAQRLHLQRIALKEQFWEAYYGKDEVALSKIEREHRSLEHAMTRAEKSLKKARAHFEKVDFDEVAEEAALKKKAYAAQEKADLRIDTLEKTIEELLAETWRNIKELSRRALRDEGEESRLDYTSQEEIHHRRSA